MRWTAQEKGCWIGSQDTWVLTQLYQIFYVNLDLILPILGITKFKRVTALSCKKCHISCTLGFLQPEVHSDCHIWENFMCNFILLSCHPLEPERTWEILVCHIHTPSERRGQKWFLLDRSPGFVSHDPIIMGQLPGSEMSASAQGNHLQTRQEGDPWLMDDKQERNYIHLVVTKWSDQISWRM